MRDRDSRECDFEVKKVGGHEQGGALLRSARRQCRGHTAVIDSSQWLKGVTSKASDHSEPLSLSFSPPLSLAFLLFSNALSPSLLGL